MKKTFRFMLAAFAIVVAASCAQELDNPDAIPQEDVELVPMTISVGGETKTTVGDDDKTINWCEDDVIAVFDMTGEPREFTIVEGTCNGKTATFEGLVAAGTTDFTAVYPYSAAVSVSNGIVTVNAAETQTLGEANIAEGATLSVASFKKGDAAFDFKTAIGYFKVVVDRADVTSIIVKGTNVAGQATFNASGELQNVTEGKNQVTLTPAADVFATGSYYLTLLPGTTAENFSVTLVRQSELATVMTADRAVEIKRNGGFFLESYKLSAKFIINDAATFQKFLSNAHNYTANDTAEIVDDINLEGVTLTSASSFKGTLDGGGHSLKKWTSEGVGLFDELAGTVKNMTIDASCAITPALNKNFGIIASFATSSAVIDYCVNNANMSTTAAVTASTRVGALVAQCEGTISNCTNNGNISIIPESVKQPIYMGGVVAFINSGTKTGLLKCTNNGDITLTVNGTASNVYMGGVTSGTTAAAVTEGTITRGTIDGCVNTGNVTYTLKNGDNMEDGQGVVGGSGNYYNVGGVAGFVMGSIINCTNGVEGDDTKGQVKTVAPTSITINAVSRPSVGGVVSFALFSVENCKNYGSISMKGSFANAGSLAQGAGISTTPTAGGVVGQVGPLASADSYMVKNCHNYGKVDLDVWMKSTSGTSMRIGGVVGHSLVKIDGCTNNAEVTVKSCAYEHQIGGIVGYGASGAVGNTNNKALTINLRGAAGNSQVRLGGVMGLGAKAFNNNINNGDILLTHPSTNKGIVYGGVVGYYNDGTTGSGTTSGQNNGTITLNCDATTDTVWMGGYAGYSNCPDEVSGVTNNGPLNVTAGATSATGIAHIGGVFGNLTKSASVKNLTNTSKGIITIHKLPNTYNVGGVIGKGDAKATFDNCDNSAVLNITANETTRTAHVHAGGVMGFNDAASTFKNCDNSGAITLNTYSGITDKTGGYSYVHGITTADNGESNLILKNNTNTGSISVNCNDSGRWRIGGICAYSGGGGECSGNVVEADIELKGKSTRDHNVGGIIAYCAKGSYTNCSYKGTITTNGSNMTGGDSGFVGGIAGRTNNSDLALKGCTIEAKINFGVNTYGGLTSGDLNADNRTIVLGSADNPVKIISGSSVNGSAMTSALEDNLMVGSRYTFSVTKTNVLFENK